MIPTDLLSLVALLFFLNRQKYLRFFISALLCHLYLEYAIT